MSHTKWNIDNVTFEQWDEAKIKEFERIGESYVGDLTTKKQDVKRLIAMENLQEIEEMAMAELDKDEFLEVKFYAAQTGGNFLSAMFFSANYYIMPMIMMDIGHRFIVFGTRKKLLIYEVRELNQVQRMYIIDYKDISKYYYKKKKNCIILCFKARKDKYDELRECSNWLLYGYLQGRINMVITSEDRELVATFFEQRINA
ncbi:hypothetical protein [Priestia taiwanensis]|uniref:Uncharacterized protein n=1 Tax=Priestia taiwanensis TaxID=1347902 RepID=A0A917AXF3_9BACI|nr:hypothetical protein [Priestia taiwanensis]MBM7364890.1 hypothetical protein [Priestia taiwanensis]GGE82869.1 hypothetical protein GCM10007140_35510 [Priestia taiwanensis]